MAPGKTLLLMIGLSSGLLLGDSRAAMQDDGRMVRLAKLTIDLAHLEDYKSALKEEVEASVRLEAGVLTLFAVSEKEHPARFTILEIYASRAAYEQHIQTPHFLKYKTATAHMVKALELVDAMPLVPEMKIK